MSKYRVFSGPYFSCIRNEYGDLPRKSPCSVWIQENTDQKKISILTIFTQSKCNRHYHAIKKKWEKNHCRRINIPGGVPAPFYLYALKHKHGSLTCINFLTFCLLRSKHFVNERKERVIFENSRYSTFVNINFCASIVFAWWTK